MIKAVIFDMDGLMLDTEAISAQAWQEAGKAFGYNITSEVVASVIGLNNTDTQKMFEQHFDADFDFEAIRKEISALEQLIYEKEIPTKPGLFELLDYLQAQGIAKAVATSTLSEKAHRMLEQVGILHYFQAVVCGDMIANSKPAPDIFLKALEMLQVDAKDALVLEDSPYGIMGAQAAGIAAIMVPDLLSPDEATRARVLAIKTNLHEVRGMLATERLSANLCTASLEVAAADGC